MRQRTQGQSNNPVTCQHPRPANGDHAYLLHQAEGGMGVMCQVSNRWPIDRDSRPFHDDKQSRTWAGYIISILSILVYGRGGAGSHGESAIVKKTTRSRLVKV